MNLKVPKYPDYLKYLWADYFELVCLQSIDRYLSKSELEDRVELQLRDKTEDSEDVLSEMMGMENFQEKLNNFSGDLISFFEYRQHVYGESYPFEVEDDKIRMKSVLSADNLFYVYLLMSSHLGYFKAGMSTLTTDFEHFSMLGLQYYFGPRAQLAVFGKNVSGRPTLFKGTEEQKFIKLAECFDAKMKSPVDFSSYSSGDGGIDIVGWINFTDKSPGKVLIAGQCKCRKDWSDSRFSSSPNALGGFIEMTHQNLNFSFIPICYRHTTGIWAVSQDVYGVILMDRQRLVTLIAGNTEDFKRSESFELVQSFVSQREDVV